MLKILYLCEADQGGIAEYALRQAAALRDAGADVGFLCRPSFPISRLEFDAASRFLPPRLVGNRFRVVKFIKMLRDFRRVAETTAAEARYGKYDVVLIACYAEYFAPCWSRILRRVAETGCSIATIAHDPMRDFVVGPLWWHRWSIRQAYSFVSHVFVHDETPIDFGGSKPEQIRIHLIPHGPYVVPTPNQERAEIRASHGFSQTDTVFLSFGQIRDGKNLDRFLRAMPSLPKSVKLLVAGTGGASSQRPPEAYVQMARELGIAERCAWDLRYIPDSETGNVFAAADHLLLTYSAKFHSASGVLNTAVASRKPVLASSGGGPLKTVVEGYQLGYFVPPDDDTAILEGARRLISTPPQPAWDRYLRENSWDENAHRVINALTSDL